MQDPPRGFLETRGATRLVCPRQDGRLPPRRSTADGPLRRRQEVALAPLVHGRSSDAQQFGNLDSSHRRVVLCCHGCIEYLYRATLQLPVEQPDAAGVFDGGQVTAEFEVAGEALDVDADVGRDGLWHALLEVAEVSEIVEQFFGVLGQ